MAKMVSSLRGQPRWVVKDSRVISRTGISTRTLIWWPGLINEPHGIESSYCHYTVLETVILGWPTPDL